MARIYVDTNVYLDYFFDRKDKLRPLGDFAFELLRKTADCHHTIIVSDLALFELKKFVDEKKIDTLFSWLSEHDKTEFAQARERLYGPNWQDRLHARIAERAGADFIVTRNIKDFETSQVRVVLPEYL